MSYIDSLKPVCDARNYKETFAINRQSILDKTGRASVMSFPSKQKRRGSRERYAPSHEAHAWDGVPGFVSYRTYLQMDLGYRGCSRNGPSQADKKLGLGDGNSC